MLVESFGQPCGRDPTARTQGCAAALYVLLAEAQGFSPREALLWPREGEDAGTCLAGVSDR